MPISIATFIKWFLPDFLLVTDSYTMLGQALVCLHLPIAKIIVLIATDTCPGGRGGPCHLWSHFLTFIGLFFFFSLHFSAFPDATQILNRNERTKREIKFDKFYLRKTLEDLCAVFFFHFALQIFPYFCNFFFSWVTF